VLRQEQQQEAAAAAADEEALNAMRRMVDELLDHDAGHTQSAHQEALNGSRVAGRDTMEAEQEAAEQEAAEQEAVEQEAAGQEAAEQEAELTAMQDSLTRLVELECEEIINVISGLQLQEASSAAQATASLQQVAARPF
jgi:hypothetical protein